MAYSSTFALVAVLALVMSPLASGLTLCSPSIAQDSCVPELFSGRAGGTNPPTHEEFHWAATAAEMTGISSWVFTFSDDDYLGGYMHWAVIDIPVTETSIPQGQAYTGQGTELKSYQGNGAGGTNRYRYAIHGLPVTNSGLNINNNKLYPQLKSEIAALGGITFEFSSLYTNSDANPGNCPPPVPPFECPLAGSADGLNADGSPIDGGQGFFTPGTTTFTIIIIVVVVAVVGAVGFLVYRMKASGSSSGGGDWGKAAQGYAVNSGGNGQWGGNNNGGGGNAYAAQQSGYGQPQQQQQQQYGNGNGYGQQQQQQQRQAPPPPSNYGRY